MQSEFKHIESLVKPGDFVFTRIDNVLYKKVADTSCSWSSHVGLIIDQNDDGSFVVAESKVPRCVYSDFENFVERSEGGRVEIRRLKGGLQEDQLRKLQEEAKSRMGSWYHFRFNYDSKMQFCSKFAYDVYRHGLGIEVGRIETFTELLHKNPQSPMGFWRLWFLGRIPMSQRTITPASLIESNKLETVYSNLDKFK
ncbi:YiiX/YebB-like N1pC/P60 family cysteine hydrolase [Lentisphaera profundi]|uniref:YiiX/YebB-like N1pC/P60 family cysteine hydrolase n=1 Tax=Lentisphaera profundi TaxID=1658616 RepID=A0ABY7VSK2_9BACT|nr:YiiX/YebB-like N1pC/P60 family cysteine hydrolase [Lentisphaera profundi]WDE96697.1 YiiX/YebB-like N1pC/P60 family cysteine hydrolase [Lentisphaera profundi]